MNSLKKVIPCQGRGCSKELRVPTDRGRITVTCPHCRTVWDWSPLSTSTQNRDLFFRCAETGGRFRVRFVRQRSSEQFRVLKVSSGRPNRDKVAGKRPENDLAKKLETLPNRPFTPDIPHSPLLSQHIKPAHHRTGEEAFLDRRSSEAVRETHSFDASEFDFAGWYCPCCGHSQHEESQPQFVQCSTCEDYVCGARIIQVNDGPQTFKCHDACKGGGRISGTIELIAGKNQITDDNKLGISAGEKRMLNAQFGD